MTNHRLIKCLIIIAILTPVGLLVPMYFGAGSAWGEWAPDEVGEMVGFVPAQMARLASLWQAPLPDYAIPGREEPGPGAQSLHYIFSALAGMAVVWALSLGVGKLLKTKKE